MKCAKCGSELKEGNVYCSVCGAEAMVVPDYSVLEDDYLRTLIVEEPQGETEPKMPQRTAEAVEEKAKKQNAGLPILIVCILLVLGISAGAAVKLMINHRNANSYDYQIQMAEQERAEKNYEKALYYYQAALALQPEDIAVRLAMTDIYLEQKEYDSAMVLLIEIINLDGSHREAYEKLIGLYDEKGDYESILALMSETSDAELSDFFAPYTVTEPIISPISGNYREETEVVIVSLDGYEIYYTTDGSIPDASTGIRYEGDIFLDEPGTYEIQAVCVNSKGICSQVVNAVYQIEYLPPKFAVVSPDGGRITERTFVMIMAEEDCSIYYTWDGTDPTTQSAGYDGPMEIPAGNNVLSVLVVNHKTGLDSGVYRTNFIYYP